MNLSEAEKFFRVLYQNCKDGSGNVNLRDGDLDGHGEGIAER